MSLEKIDHTSLRLPRFLLLGVATLSALSLVVAAIWYPGRTVSSFLPPTPEDFAQEMVLGNLYGYGETVPVTEHHGPESRFLRVELGHETDYTGFGIARGVSVPDGVLHMRWRAQGHAANIALELQATPADLPGRATWFVSLKPPGSDWTEVEIPLASFTWNEWSNPQEWTPRPLDSSTLYGVSLTIPPRSRIEIDLASLEIETTTRKSLLLTGLGVLLLLLVGCWYMLVLISRHRSTEASLATSELERQSLEDQLVQAQKMEAVGRLAGGVAHDFNNYLTGIMVACDMGRRQTARDDTLTWFTTIREIADSASEVTQQLLAFSRGQPLKKAPVSVNDLVAESMRLAGHACRPGIEFDIVPQAERDAVLADGTRIRQALINLAVNAGDAMPDGGTITVTTDNVTLDAHADCPVGEYVRLRVRDTGSGVDESIRASIFDPFFTTKETGKGTGLGLSMVYGIVHQHNGSIELTSPAGEGAEFTIWLPALGSTIEPQTVAGRMEEASGGTEAILVLEDETTIRDLIGSVLEEQGYDVCTAASPADADAVLADGGRVDLVLSDVVMPGETGPSYYRRLRQQRPDLPVLFMTGYAEQTGAASELDPEWPLIMKPFDPHELSDRIRSLLDEGRV